MLLVALLAGLASDSPALLVPADGLPHLRSIARNAPAIHRFAERALKLGPWSVTAHRPPNAAGLDVHEYYSEGPYWWPDPKNPKGPYIRRDGDRNPDRFDDNHRDVGSISEAVLALGMGAALLADGPRYASRASEVLSIWFVDPKTRMNPDLEHGQAIQGREEGRGTGIIDTVALIHAVQGITLLEQSGHLDAKTSAGVREWFRTYTHWLTSSLKGRAEEDAKNNHAVWWTAQVAAFASYLNDEPLMRSMWERYRKTLLKQIKPDGSMPLEEARTHSLSYSAYNLDAFALVCRIAEVRGEHLWAPMAKPLAYLMPFVVNPVSWTKPQTQKFNPAGYVFPALAGLGLKDDKLIAEYRKMPIADAPWPSFVAMLVESSR